MYSAYIEFETKVLGQPTIFRVFETGEYLYLSISQDVPEPKYFNKTFEKTIHRKRIICSRKKRIIFCRLKGYEYLRQASRVMFDLLRGKKRERAKE